MADNDQQGLCIPYTVRATVDKGRGVFADATIDKGTILWRHQRGQYKVYDEQELNALLNSLSHSEAIYELTHMFGVAEFPEHVIRVLDDGVLINHSPQPTVAMSSLSDNYQAPTITGSHDVAAVQEALLNDYFSLFATRDLKVGDELTMDYNVGTQDPDYFDELCKQYDLTWPWL
jgi:SET domain-containing protein